MSAISLIVTKPLELARGWCSVSTQARAQKEAVLADVALIGRVTNQRENDAATDAMKRLKALSSQFERERKAITEPLLEAQRELKRVVDVERDELDRECGRIECLVKDFALAEQRRIREEQEAQRRELERIEREKQAELKRIAEEQEKLEREAKAARDAAESEAIRLEAEKRIAELAAKSQQVQEAADLAARIESKPVEITRSFGQQTRKVWVIKQINDFQLMKARPDLVRKIEWDIVAIKEILNSGQSLPGVVAEEDLRVGVRGKASQPLIEV